MNRINRAKKIRRELISIFVPVILVLAIIYIFFTYCVTRSKIISRSMEPTLKVGDVVYINKLAYIRSDIQRGDVVWFICDEEGNEGDIFVKRVIGLPGDAISFEDGYVFINGVMLDESAYLDSDIETDSSKSFNVPDGCYFLMGDNRENSNDCRRFANPYIPRERIIGKFLGKEAFWK